MKQLWISTIIIFYSLGYILTHPWVWKYIALAILINIFTLIALLAGFWGMFGFVNQKIIEISGIDPNAGANVIWQLLLVILGGFLVILVYLSLSMVVNAPVYSRLSSRIIKEQISDKNEVERTLVAEIGYAVEFEIKKLLLVFAIFLLSFPLNIIPFVGQFLFTFLNFIQMILLIGLELFEPILTLKGIGFRAKLLEILSKPLEYWPFLTIAGFLCAIPIVNIFTVPVCIIAATLLYVQIPEKYPDQDPVYIK